MLAVAAWDGVFLMRQRGAKPCQDSGPRRIPASLRGHGPDERVDEACSDRILDRRVPCPCRPCGPAAAPVALSPVGCRRPPHPALSPRGEGVPSRPSIGRSCSPWGEGQGEGVHKRQPYLASRGLGLRTSRQDPRQKLRYCEPRRIDPCQHRAQDLEREQMRGNDPMKSPM